MSQITRYIIDNMRAVTPDAATVARRAKDGNPPLFVTVKGSFFAVNDDGSRGDPYTFKSKPITLEMARADGFAIDLKAGTLSVVGGEQGRPEVAGIDADALDALLAEVRATPNVEAEVSTEGAQQAEGEQPTAEQPKSSK